MISNLLTRGWSGSWMQIAKILRGKSWSRHERNGHVLMRDCIRKTAVASMTASWHAAKAQWTLVYWDGFLANPGNWLEEQKRRSACL